MPFRQMNREKNYIAGLQIGEHPAAYQVGVGIQETVGDREQHGEPQRVRRASHDGSISNRNDPFDAHAAADLTLVLLHLSSYLKRARRDCGSALRQWPSPAPHASRRPR